MNIIYTTSVQQFTYWSKYKSAQFHPILLEGDNREIQKLKQSFLLNAMPVDGKEICGKGYYYIKEICSFENPQTGKKTYYAKALYKENNKQRFMEEVEVSLYVSALYYYNSLGRKDIPIERLIGSTIRIERAFSTSGYTNKKTYSCLNYCWSIVDYFDPY